MVLYKITILFTTNIKVLFGNPQLRIQIQADEYAFNSCGKDADLIFTNCTGVIEENAFQYGDFLSLTISNCELKIEKSAFSTCEDLTSVVFTDSTLETEEYALYSCGDSAKIEMTNCSLIFDDRTFQFTETQEKD